MNSYPNPFATFVPRTPDYEPEGGYKVVVKEEYDTSEEVPECEVVEISDDESSEEFNCEQPIEITINEHKFCNDWKEDRIKGYGRVSFLTLITPDIAYAKRRVDRYLYALIKDFAQPYLMSTFEIVVASLDEHDEKEFACAVTQVWDLYVELYRDVLDAACMQDIYKSILRNDESFMSKIALHTKYEYWDFLPDVKNDDKFIYILIDKDLFLKDLNKELENYQ